MCDWQDSEPTDPPEELDRDVVYESGFQAGRAFEREQLERSSPYIEAHAEGLREGLATLPEFLPRYLPSQPEPLHLMALAHLAERNGDWVTATLIALGKLYPAFEAAVATAMVHTMLEQH